MSLILDAYGRPVLHPGDIVAIRDGSKRVREPLRITRIVGTNHRDADDIQCNCEQCGPSEAYRIYFKEAMNSKEEWVFSHDIEVKLLARAETT